MLNQVARRYVDKNYHQSPANSVLLTLTPTTDLSAPRMRRAAKDYIAMIDQRDAAERLNDIAWA